MKDEFVTAFVSPGDDDDHNPWRDLWIRVESLGPWALYPKVYRYERAYCAYCGAWRPSHEDDCPYLLAMRLIGETSETSGDPK